MTGPVEVLANATPVSLWPHQATTIEAIIERLRAGRRAPLVVLPTGGGKTVVLATLIARHLARSDGHRVLVLAHRRELVTQIASTLERSGVDAAQIHPDAAPIADERVFVASTQTLLARETIPEGITLLVFDEAHHYSADEWSALADAFPDALRLGFTATPSRSDGRGLSPTFDSLVIGATVKQLTKDGFLVPCRVIAPKEPLRARQLVCSPLAAYLEHAVGRRTVVFAEFVSDAIGFRDEFLAAGILAVVVHGELDADERAEALRAHREDGAVLVNVMCLTEGWDAPSTAIAILARGCGSITTYLQIVGRVLRCSAGKTEALLIDLTGRAFFAHGPPDEEREFSLTGRGIRRKGRQDGMTCFVCGSLVEAWPCDVCGHTPEGTAREPLRLVGGDLAERYAEKRAEDVSKQTETLARWMAECRARGWNGRSVYRKFQHVYNVMPSGSMIEAAKVLSYTLACTDCVSCGRATVKTYRGGQCGKCAFGEHRGAA